MVIQQPALPAYRIPVFRELARREGLEVLVRYGHDPALPNVEADGFAAEPSETRSFGVGSREVLWDGSQLRYATKRRADVLVLTWNAHYASLPMALLRARLSGVGTVLWGHGYSKAEAGWRAGVRRWLGRRADALLFYSASVAERYAAVGFDAGRLFTAANALDQSPMQAARAAWAGREEELKRFRAERGLGDGSVALFVSRFAPANREDLLIEAAAVLKDRLPGFRVVLIGKGETAGELRALAERLGVADRVIMPGAIYGEANLAPWFLCSDVFVYPANVGLSLIHAMGYGLPVVVGDDLASHNPEIDALRPGENGAVFRDGDAGSLAGVLAGLFADREKLASMRMEAERTVTERFTLARMVDGFEAAIRRASRR
ncbi:glycosyltransferase family 4 protein [Mucisphaera sp.]|uniref:glycosyltransferase family 4 protein n=1 Tax=Mucisphaera sp. TaxID=2913024 RepID=UPI003D13BAD2